jgi:hypothetical protein
MAHQSHSRRDFLQSTVALAASVMGSPKASSRQTASTNPLDDADGQDVAVASIWRPERNLRINAMSVSFGQDYPAAHGLQQEFDGGGLSRPARRRDRECEAPFQVAQDAHRMALTFFEAEEPGIELDLDCSQVDNLGVNGDTVITRETHGLQIAAGTAVARRWHALGMSYQHWITRALLGPLLSDFPCHVGREDIQSVLAAGWGCPDQPGHPEDSRHSRISLSQIALVPLDSMRPDAAIWRVWDEIQEAAEAYLSGPPIGYLLTVHAAQKPIATLRRESNALRVLVGPDLPLICGLDILTGPDISPFVSLVAVLDMDRSYTKD